MRLREAEGTQLSQSRVIRQGAIHILEQCPPLHGESQKDRPVVVVAVEASKLEVLIVAVSSTVGPSVADRIALPDRSSQPQTTSGLSKPSWAVPEWYLYIPPSRLGEKIGYVSGGKLREIVKAVQVHIAAGRPPVTLE